MRALTARGIVGPVRYRGIDSSSNVRLGRDMPDCYRSFVRLLPVARLVLLTQIAWSGAAGFGFAAEQVISDFNGTGFSYTFDNFAATPGPTSVRLFSSPPDEDPGWGGGGLVFNPTLNLSSLANGRWVVDMTRNPGNGVGSFTLEMYDTSNRSGKWTMNVGALTPGVATHLVSTTTIANPTDGVGDWQNLNLSQISSMNILGEWASPATFDSAVRPRGDLDGRSPAAAVCRGRTERTVAG